MIRLTGPSDVSGGTAYAAQARMQSGDYNDKKQALKAVVFLAVFLWLLVTVTYIIRTNGDVKDRFTGFYAEKENTIDAILVGSSPVYPYYSAPALYGKKRHCSISALDK